MREYLRWGCEQLYLLIFWPSRFHEVKEANVEGLSFAVGLTVRLVRFFRCLPFLALLASLLAFLYSSLLAFLGSQTTWTRVCISLAVGLISGVSARVAWEFGRAVLLSILQSRDRRHKRRYDVRFGPAVQAFFISLTIGTLGVTFVWQKRQIYQLGEKTYHLEKRLSALKRENETRRQQWLMLNSLPYLDVRVKELKLDLRLPTADQLISLPIEAGAPMEQRSPIELAELAAHEAQKEFNRRAGLKISNALNILASFDVVILVASFSSGARSLLAIWLFFFHLPFQFVNEVLAFIASIFLQRNVSTKVIWKWHPLRWNEVVWWQLEAADDFLRAMVREDWEFGFGQLAFITMHRRRQCGAISQALFALAKEDLVCAQFEEFPLVERRLSWTERNTSLLPDVLRTTLPVFERVARHTAQGQTLTSPFRRCEALDTALAELRTLQLNLATAIDQPALDFRPSFLRGLMLALRRRINHRVEFLKVATDWETLLRAERDKAAALITAVPLPNPFAFGPPVRETEDQRFTGRRDVLQDMERALLGSETVPTLLLLGARRMGKSSLLNQLPRLLGPDCAPAVVDAQGANSNSLPGLALACAREVSEALRRRRVEPPAVDRAAFERDPLFALDDWVRAVETRLPGKLRVLLCVDEYERLEEAVKAGWGGQFLDQMRHILQHHPRFGLMFTGAKPLRALGPAWTDRFISVRPLRVSFLREEDMRLLLTKPIPEFDLDYHPGALERLMDLTRGQPFLTQCVAYELVDRLNAANRKHADPADVDAAATKARETGDAYFANLWSDAGPDGQAALRALLQTGTPPASGPIRTLLRELEILTDEGDFAVPLVRRWVEAEIAKGN